MTKRKSPEEQIVYTYRGPGRSPLGIPDRSLTAAEFEGLSFLQQLWVQESTIYVLAGSTEPTIEPPEGGEDA